MRAEHRPQNCGCKLVSPSEKFDADNHNETNEQLKPVGAGGEGEEQHEEDQAGEMTEGLGRGMAAEEEMQEGTGAKSGGASSAPAPGVRRQQKEEGAEEEGEEGREAKRIPIPSGPSKEEREKHNLTHTPYRSWCPHCVRARGRSTQHKKGDKEQESLVPRISFDYFFLTKEDESGEQKSHDCHGG